MKKLLLFIFLGFTGLAYGQVRVNLNNLSSVTFPHNPTKTKTDSVNTVYSATQNGGYYIATIEDMSKRADLSANSDSLKRFYDNLLNTTIKKLNGKLAYKENLTVNGAPGIDFGYTLDNKAGFPDTRFQRSVYINKTLLTFAFWTFKDKLKANAADRDIFFNSIVDPSEPAPPTPYQPEVKGQTEVTTPPADSAKTPAQQIATKATVDRVGYSVVYILGAIFLAAVIIGLLVYFKKTFYNKKNNE